MNRLRFFNPIPLSISVLLLLGLGFETSFRPHPDDALPYHAAVQAAGMQVPDDLPGWAGEPVEVPASAVRILQPNLLISKRFQEVFGNRSLDLLLVHCRDARDLYGHYPPVCYPAHGMEARGVESFPVEVGGRRYPVTEYRFASRDVGAGAIRVWNFLIMPDRVAPDMNAVGDLVGDYVRRIYGAAQVQVIFHDLHPWTDAERQDLFRTMVQTHLPVIERVLSGEALDER